MGGNRRRVGDIGESTGLVTAETEGVGYENPAAQNEDPVYLIQKYLRTFGRYRRWSEGFDSGRRGNIVQVVVCITAVNVIQIVIVCCA